MYVNLSMIPKKKYTLVISSLSDSSFRCRVVISAENVKKAGEQIRLFKKIFGVNHSMFCKIG